MELRIAFVVSNTVSSHIHTHSHTVSTSSHALSGKNDLECGMHPHVRAPANTRRRNSLVRAAMRLTCVSERGRLVSLAGPEGWWSEQRCPADTNTPSTLQPRYFTVLCVIATSFILFETFGVGKSWKARGTQLSLTPPLNMFHQMARVAAAGGRRAMFVPRMSAMQFAVGRAMVRRLDGTR